MDNKNIVRIVSVCTIVLFFGCATVPTEETSIDVLPTGIIEEFKVYAPGQWQGNEFSSEWFGFRYKPTQGMLLTSEENLKEINAVQSMNFDGPNAELEDYTKMQIAYEVMAKSIDSSVTLDVLSEKIFADDLTAEQYAEILINELSITHGRDVTFNENIVRRVGNTEYLDLSSEINIEGSTVYQTVLLSQKGSRFATILIMYKEAGKLEELLAGFSPY